MIDSGNHKRLEPLRKLKELLRISPHDIDNVQGRAEERQRRIAWTSISAAVAKFSTALAMLISTPLTLNYLGTERFGLWATITAVIAMLNFADLGLGNGILNVISHASGRGEKRKIRVAITSGIGLLSFIGLLFAVLFLAVYRSVDWSALIGLNSDIARDESGPLFMALVLCMAVNFPLCITQKVQLALQRGYWGNLWDSIGSLIGLLGIFLAVNLDGGLIWIALASAGIPVIFRLFNTLLFFCVQSPGLAPAFYHFSPTMAQRLIRSGGLFLVLQLAVIIGFQSDNIIISHILGAESVSDYSVAMRLFTLPAMVLGMLAMAQWPAYGEAFTRGDFIWIQQTYASTLKRSLAAVIPISIVLALFGHWLLRVWAGPEIQSPVELLIGMSLWCVVLVAGNVISSLMNGLHIVRFQVVCATLMASVNIMLSIALVQGIGVSGAIYGTLIAYTLLSLLPCWYYCSRRLRKLTSEAHLAQQYGP